MTEKSAMENWVESVKPETGHAVGNTEASRFTAEAVETIPQGSRFGRCRIEAPGTLRGDDIVRSLLKNKKQDELHDTGSQGASNRLGGAVPQRAAPLRCPFDYCRWKEMDHLHVGNSLQQFVKNSKLFTIIVKSLDQRSCQRTSVRGVRPKVVECSSTRPGVS